MSTASYDITMIYTDGACLGNPGPGGYAAMLVYQGGELVFTGGEHDTTNNRMEMMAAIRALEELPVGRGAVLHSDSQILIKGMNEWRHSWAVKGWRTAARKPVENRDLWHRLIALSEARTVEWQWVRGHAGHKENERVDALASEAAQRMAEVGEGGLVPSELAGKRYDR